MPLILIHLESATALAQLSCELNKITYVSGLSFCGEQSHQCNHCPTRILYKVKVNDAMEIAKKKTQTAQNFPLSLVNRVQLLLLPPPPYSPLLLRFTPKKETFKLPTFLTVWKKRFVQGNKDEKYNTKKATTIHSVILLKKDHVDWITKIKL